MNGTVVKAYHLVSKYARKVCSFLFFAKFSPAAHSARLKYKNLAPGEKMDHKTQKLDKIKMKKNAFPVHFPF